MRRWDRDQTGGGKRRGLFGRFLSVLGGAALVILLFYLYLMLTR